MAEKEHYFYDKPIFADREMEYIKDLLKKYKGEEADDKLREKIWNELQREKHLGNITIPFKIVTRRDEYGRFPEYIEVILDTKV